MAIIIVLSECTPDLEDEAFICGLMSEEIYGAVICVGKLASGAEDYDGNYLIAYASNDPWQYENWEYIGYGQFTSTGAVESVYLGSSYSQLDYLVLCAWVPEWVPDTLCEYNDILADWVYTIDYS